MVKYIQNIVNIEKQTVNKSEAISKKGVTKMQFDLKKVWKFVQFDHNSRYQV